MTERTMPRAVVLAALRALLRSMDEHPAAPCAAPGDAASIDSPMPDVVLVLAQTIPDSDWYCIERADLPRVEEWRPTSDGGEELYCSARISDADVEGPRVEMLALAKAIQARGRVEFKRCAVDATADPVRFWSPRNSERPGEASLEAADRLAAEIVASLALPPVTSAEELRKLLLSDRGAFAAEVDRLLPLVRDRATKAFWETLRDMATKGT